jgi:hypothetical protein
MNKFTQNLLSVPSLLEIFSECTSMLSLHLDINIVIKRSRYFYNVSSYTSVHKIDGKIK